MSSQAWINLAYLTASMLFIVAFKQMSGPRTAVRGNFLGAVGMAIAILAACFEQPVAASIGRHGIWPLLLLALFAAAGGGIGATMALRWPMTGMPQMVALLNGFGGAASMLVAAAELTSTRAVARFQEGRLRYWRGPAWSHGPSLPSPLA
jgi:NAD(P) transhydrogenase subunit beta